MTKLSKEKGALRPLKIFPLHCQSHPLQSDPVSIASILSPPPSLIREGGDTHQDSSSMRISTGSQVVESVPGQAIFHVPEPVICSVPQPVVDCSVPEPVVNLSKPVVISPVPEPVVNVPQPVIISPVPQLVIDNSMVEIVSGIEGVSCQEEAVEDYVFVE